MFEFIAPIEARLEWEAEAPFGGAENHILTLSGSAAKLADGSQRASMKYGMESAGADHGREEELVDRVISCCC